MLFRSAHRNFVGSFCEGPRTSSGTEPPCQKGLSACRCGCSCTPFEFDVGGGGVTGAGPKRNAHTTLARRHGCRSSARAHGWAASGERFDSGRKPVTPPDVPPRTREGAGAHTGERSLRPHERKCSVPWSPVLTPASQPPGSTGTPVAQAAPATVVRRDRNPVERIEGRQNDEFREAGRVQAAMARANCCIIHRGVWPLGGARGRGIGWTRERALGHRETSVGAASGRADARAERSHFAYAA